MTKIVKENEFKHLKQYDNTYIKDILQHIACTLYDKYRINIQNNGYLDLSNLNLNEYTLKSLYYRDIREELPPFIKHNELCYKKHMQHLIHRESLEECWETGPACFSYMSYIYCQEITVINLAKNPKLNLSHIFILFNVCTNIKKIL